MRLVRINCSVTTADSTRTAHASNATNRKTAYPSVSLSIISRYVLRHRNVADLDSTLHLSLHQAAAITDPKLGLRPFFDVDAASYLACLTYNDKAWFVFKISPKKMIPSCVEDLGFYIKIRAARGHSSLPRGYNPDALGDLLDLRACRAMGHMFHVSSHENYHSIDQHGLFAHGLGKEKGRVGVHFVYAGGTSPPRHGTVIRRGKDIHYWNLNYEKFLADGFQLRGMPNGVLLATMDEPRAYLEALYVMPPEHHQQSLPREPPMPPPQCREKPPASSNDRINGDLRTRDENAKHFSRFVSSINVVTFNAWYLWEKGFTKLWILGRDGASVEAKGRCGEPRIHLMEYRSLPDGVRTTLDITDELEWMSHPLSGYLLLKVITPDNRYFHAHGYGLPRGFPDPGSLSLIRESADLFWGLEKTLSPEVLARGESPKYPKSSPDDEGYAAAHAEYQDKIQRYAVITETFYEGIYIKTDFDLMLELFHELSSKDLFAHNLKHKDDESVRRKRYASFPNVGPQHVYYDSP